MIKRIQLRGISRTPSDRMNEDGGVSESLNMYLDQAESAPAFVPEDVTEEIGLPEGLKAERIFIHKTTNYENYIVALSDKIVAYTSIENDVEPLLVMELSDGETLSDITSIGNILIVSTLASLHYILYKDKKYSFLGHSLPFPIINFENQPVEKDHSLHDTAEWEVGELLFGGLPDKEAWNNDGGIGKHHTKYLRPIEALWSAIEGFALTNIKHNVLSGPVVVRYALVDVFGSEYSSAPILLCPGGDEFRNAKITIGQTTISDVNKNADKVTPTSLIETKLSLYKIFAKLTNASELVPWSDLCSKIRIYMGQGLFTIIDKKSSYMESVEHKHVVTPDGDYVQIVEDYDIGSLKLATYRDLSEDIVDISSNTFMISEFDVFVENTNIFSEKTNLLSEGIILDVQKFLDTSSSEYTKLEVQNPLVKDDMQHYSKTAKQLSTFNNQLLLLNPSQNISFDYDRLNSYVITKGAEHNKEINEIIYDVTFVLATYTGDKYIKKRFSYSKTIEKSERILAFQVFPDSRAYKMIVKATTISYGQQAFKYGVFTMQPFPFLNASYYYGGLHNELANLCTLDTADTYPSISIDDAENKIFISAIDSPIDFPINKRYTFQSKVIGVAVANTALSQGQFGQFPLYVFTEDGIWAMETGADGSFLSQKPLSREVCINPDSITSIDNAVVFVTAKGVMVIQGSQVTNISPNMNGRHYILDDQAEKVIRISYTRDNNFNDLIEPMQDEDSFMSFIKDAKIAYDYVGQRLIFISPSNKKFQYVYKLDTLTWHKVSFSGLELVAPINSFPECLITVEAEGMDPDVYQAVSDTLELNKDQMKDFLAGNMITKYHQKDKGDKYYWTDKCNTLYDLYGVDISIKTDEYIEATIDIDTVKPGVDTSSSDAQWVCALLGISKETLDSMKNGENLGIYTFLSSIYDIDLDYSFLDEIFLYSKLRESEVFETNLTLEEYEAKRGINTKVYSMSTVLDDSRDQQTAKGCIISRPFDLGEPDVYKTIKDVRIRGQFRKGAVKYILEGSDDGETFHVITSRRGKSWKMFRIILLADLEPTERISWVDIDYETRFTNRLR